MASEDVIELGSSDEESEPPPKKMKTNKPMVYIPNNLSELTIRPAKSKTKVAKGNSPQSSKCKVASVAPKNVVLNPYAGVKAKSFGVRQVIQVKGNKSNGAPDALKMVNKLTNPIKVVSIPPQSKIRRLIQIPKPTVKGLAMQKLTKLPPGLTITKKTNFSPNVKPKIVIPIKNISEVKPKAPVISNSGQLLTVEIDDEEESTAASASGPQWYVRPEDQKEANDSPEKVNNDENNKEKQNNEEPKTNFIEITIEDSPIKLKNKRTDEIGNELAITIEDSPIKNNDRNDSDNNSDNEPPRMKEKQSKKKLEYPKDGTIEIEIDPISIQCKANEVNKENKNTDIHVIEIEASPAKLDNFQSSTPKKNKTNKNDKPHLKEFGGLSDINEKFHPVYQDFINLCRELENSDDMNKIIEKKIKSYYRQVPTSYTESEIFIDMVSSKITAMKACPEKMYLYIKDVVDELNLQRKMAKMASDKKNEEHEKFLYGEESEFDSKRQRQIRKLEKTIKKLHRAIQKLEEQEVDFDDEDDSVYLLTERYKERMVRVHAKFCQLTNTKMPSEPRVQIDPRPGQPKGPAKRLEKWINKKVPIGTPLPFPDFHDVLRCVREANIEDNLGWNEADIMEEARDLFTRCGKKLQRRRQENEWRLAASRISEVDPAEGDDDLKKKLDLNQRTASKKESEVLNKYVERQNQLNLEAIEIGDKEAEESPVESDDEDPVEESSPLANKELRKERIKRLLHEKSNKVSKTGNKESEAISEKPADNDENGETDTPPKKVALENTTIQGPSRKDEVTDLKDEETSKTQEDEGKILSINSTEDNNRNENNDDDKILSLSDDSNNLDSDIDELHLLQKLHSPKGSSVENSSDSDSTIAISDTLSSGDNKKPSSDVISIENSSYSESEGEEKTNANDENTSQKKENLETVKEVELPNSGEERKLNKTNNDECNESIEDILLASSDDENEKQDENKPEETNNIDNGAGHVQDNIEQENLQDNQIHSVTDSPITDINNIKDDDIVSDTVVQKCTVDNNTEGPMEVCLNPTSEPMETDEIETSENTKLVGSQPDPENSLNSDKKLKDKISNVEEVIENSQDN